MYNVINIKHKQRNAIMQYINQYNTNLSAKQISDVSKLINALDNAGDVRLDIMLTAGFINTMLR